MLTKKIVSRAFSVLLVFMFMLTGSLPMQTATAAIPNTADLPGGLSADEWAQIQSLLPATATTPPDRIDYLKASNTGSSDYFGETVSLSGDTLVVGAPGECSNASGVNGNGANNSAVGSGAAYVFIRSGGVWSQQAYLKASNTETIDNFGYSVSVSGDTLVVGAYREDSNASGVNGNQADNSASASGAAYVFTRSGTTWSQQAYLKASNSGVDDWFGWSVSLSGNTLVVGAYQEDSNATGVNGEGVNNLSSNSGAAYVFTRSSTTWSQQAYLKASNSGPDDWFGHAVSISGDTLLVGAFGEDSNSAGSQADNSASASGAAYVFTRSGSTWSQQAYLKASNAEPYDWFGWSVSLSGDTLLVGAYREDSNATGVNGDGTNNAADASGAAYVFTRSGGTSWSQQAYLKASNTGVGDWFGWCVSLSGDTLVVGALEESGNATGVNGDGTNNSASMAGAAYLYTRSGSTWSLQAYLKASNTGAEDYFGSDVSVSGDTIVVGAYAEDSNASAVNGNGADNSVLYSGAAYVYSVSAPSLATFTDVPETYWAYTYIESLYNAGITGGCGTNPLVYCPENPVTRAQMAIFLERGMNGSAYIPPTGTGVVFGDVPASYWAMNWIEKLYADGITSGCGSGNYCPETAVTRAQMAIFLLRSKHGAAYVPPTASGTMFTDVPSTYWAVNWIEQLATEGITGGCGTGLYCPDNPVTRAQMAVFLVRTFSLP